MTGVLRVGLGLLLAAATVAPLAASAPAIPLPERLVVIEARAIPHFRIGRPDLDTFGRLRWIGGLELEADTRRVGGLSGLVIREGGAALTAVTDDGLMLAARIDRDPDGRPAAISDARIRGLDIVVTTERERAAEADAEGFDVVEEASGTTAYVSFETMPRVGRGPLLPDGTIGRLDPVALPEDLVEGLRWSKGLETLAAGPPGSPLDGRIVLVAERPMRGAETGARPGWIVGGETVGRFALTDDGYDVTDAAFGPDGDLYVLERLYTLAEGVRSQIRRVEAGALVDGALIPGETVFEADLSHQIDNMEAIDLWTDATGRTVVSLLSDDNRSFMQRTVYLEFELLAE